MTRSVLEVFLLDLSMCGEAEGLLRCSWKGLWLLLVPQPHLPCPSLEKVPLQAALVPGVLLGEVCPLPEEAGPETCAWFCAGASSPVCGRLCPHSIRRDSSVPTRDSFEESPNSGEVWLALSSVTAARGGRNEGRK